ncbi:TetR/AcrR family transcriptional regulator [Methanobrevibacter oralis]|uniref:Nucleoid occlusion factor SlmA n=1 Tax=Methanobrevibacter oralis TaxID=66851 RepID=A0A166BNN9_METOA|nr:TetR/AcrR family transcriptional regulator [Methanobrevibacter oralis]KZX13611.1 nucleoid occlusion factor SlmA [Methanobrevibacter oralis]
MEVKAGSVEERIINASFDVLEKEGYSGATTKKIAKKANINEVTLFRKFKSKHRLMEIVKEYYSDYLINQLEEIFQFNDEISFEEYSKNCFYKIVNLSDNELNIIKIGLEEVRNPGDEQLFSKTSDMIINKLTEFFKIKIAKKEIKKVNPHVLALNMFSILFESMILWKVYGKSPHYDIDQYVKDFLEIIINGIKCEV